MTTEFLQEIVNYKHFSSYFDDVVACYGISQDPNNKNYIMVMQYMNGRDLRHRLSSNPLSFRDKLYGL